MAMFAVVGGGPVSSPLTPEEQERNRRRREFASNYTYTFANPEEKRIAEQQTAREQRHYAEVKNDLDNHLRNNGRFFTRQIVDSSGRTVTQQVWRGTRADGSRAADQVLRSAYGKHTLAEFDSGELELRTDNYTKQFNKGAAYLLQRNVAYQMDPHERALKEKMDADKTAKLAEYDRQNPVAAPTGRSKEASSDGIVWGMSDREVADQRRQATRETYKGEYWDRDAEKRVGYEQQVDKRWKQDDGTFASRADKLLYELGVDKDEWTNADRAGRKKILADLYQNEGVGSVQNRYVRGKFMDFISDRRSLGRAQGRDEAVNALNKLWERWFDSDYQYEMQQKRRRG